MKKVVSLLLCLVLSLIVFSSCNKDKEYTIDIFICNEANQTDLQLRQSVEYYLSRIEGVTCRFYDAENDMEKQLEQVDEAVKDKSDLLIVQLVQNDDSPESYRVVMKAKDASLPVIFIDRQVEPTAVASYKSLSMFIGYNQDSAADVFSEMVGQYIIDNFSDIDLNGDDTISYIMFRGVIGNIESSKRTISTVTKINGMLLKEELNELVFYDENSQVSYMASDGKRELAKRYMQDALAAFPFDEDNPIELIMANNDILALGVIEALQEVGYNLGDGESPTIPIFALDGTPDGLDAVKQGLMSGTVYIDQQSIAVQLAIVVKILANSGTIEDYLAPIREQTEEAEDTETIIRVDEGTDLVYLPFLKVYSL